MNNMDNDSDDWLAIELFHSKECNWYHCQI